MQRAPYEFTGWIGSLPLDVAYDEINLTPIEELQNLSRSWALLELDGMLQEVEGLANDSGEYFISEDVLILIQLFGIDPISIFSYDDNFNPVINPPMRYNRSSEDLRQIIKFHAKKLTLELYPQDESFDYTVSRFGYGSWEVFDHLAYLLGSPEEKEDTGVLIQLYAATTAFSGYRSPTA